MPANELRSLANELPDQPANRCESNCPGEQVARVCPKHETYPDGREFVGIGIIPDTEISPSAQDIAEQRDVVLEKGVVLLTGKMSRR